MNQKQTEFFNGAVFSEIMNYAVISKERAVKETSVAYANFFEDKEQAKKATERAIHQLEKQGFIEVNEAGNIVTKKPVEAYQKLGETA